MFAVRWVISSVARMSGCVVYVWVFTVVRSSRTWTGGGHGEYRPA